MITFTDEQKDYLRSDISSHIFLEACPGSGKTEIVAAKVAQEITRWERFPSGIAVLSFSNSATDELRDRIAEYLPEINSYFPHFVGTFDSFVYKNIVSPLAKELTGFNGSEGGCSIRIVEKMSTLGYRTKYGIAKKGNIYAHHFEYDLKNNKIHFDSGVPFNDNMLNAVDLQEWQIADLIAAKNRMLSGGFATYRDIENLACKALSEDGNIAFIDLLSKRFPIIIIDECQDLSFGQLQILQKLSDSGVNMHFIGDLHQAIYGFRDVEPEDVNKFVKRNLFTSLPLKQNLRSCQKIINLCGKLTGRNDIIGLSSQLEPVCYIVQYNTCPTEVIGVFDKLTQEYKNCVIVAAGHSTLQKFDTSATDLKPIHKLALAIKTFDPNKMESLEKSLLLLSEFIRTYLEESVKPNSFNCPERVDSKLQWRRFLYASLSHFTENGMKKFDKDWSSWVKAIKPLVNKLIISDFVFGNIEQAIEPLRTQALKAPSGQARQIVEDTLGNIITANVNYRKATIHGVKGETHDVTMLVSTAKRTGRAGSHWKDWLKCHEAEPARLAYVASSRPKYRLIWAVKKLNIQESNELTDLGFNIQPL